eukprot:CAMPEP_0119108404 /NCGR_PEP_ID=MMETSP1180-20130426/14195_1 /TAXON_ID=3052 ORGANISM="Chlamydomonas cf sp, Strain CCMP681" /NCGR_SAMPLE_ID=MMETSP1180 /ASSEMBLY_ACC=CAM_ASM_000741 /LENGTH=385 /DNA_ID=CAMNT_0007094011 /DNA_START=122 /DNA_END=1279 /DNA_ORIENTATION=-
MTHAHAHLSQQIDQGLRPMAQAVSQHLQRVCSNQQQHRSNASRNSQPLWLPVLASMGLPLAPIYMGRQDRGKRDSSTQPQQASQPSNSHEENGSMVKFSSGGSGQDSSRPQNCLFQVAMAKDEVKARLAPIPVFTVANPKNEFVLVAGENNTQLGFFFFRREDAEAIVEKIREENPRLARDSKILRVTMDNVYEVFTTPRDQTGLQGIHFRFMPDMRQVAHALGLYREAGVPTRSFQGVPVFQAEGLTVTTQDMQYVPLFLNKEDLDIAVQSAYKQRNAAQIKVYRDKALKYEEEYNQVEVQANSALGREKVSLETRASKAKSKLKAAKEKADAVERAPMPKIEVGSFEEVMQRMTASSGNELAAWNQVMFVAPGLVSQAVSKEA